MRCAARAMPTDAYSRPENVTRSGGQFSALLQPAKKKPAVTGNKGQARAGELVCPLPHLEQRRDHAGRTRRPGVLKPALAHGDPTSKSGCVRQSWPGVDDAFLAAKVPFTNTTEECDRELVVPDLDPPTEARVLLRFQRACLPLRPGSDPGRALDRHLLSRVPRSAQPFVATVVRTIFTQPSAEEVHAQLGRVAEQLATRFPEVARLLEEAGSDIAAFAGFPVEHWRQIWSNNPQERLDRENRRRTDVVGIFPDWASILRLVGAVLAEQHDEWQVARRYMGTESLAKVYAHENDMDELNEEVPMLMAS